MGSRVADICEASRTANIDYGSWTADADARLNAPHSQRRLAQGLRKTKNKEKSRRLTLRYQANKKNTISQL